MVYVGQTVQLLKDRWKQHCVRDNSRNGQSYLHNAIKKYGKENFTVEQIDGAVTLNGLNILEIHYINTLNTLSPNGYNLDSGGDSRLCHEDTKAKISATMKGRAIPNRWTKGFVGKHSEETKQLISKKLQGTVIPNHWNKGNPNPCSEDTKAKISATLTGVPQPSKYKQVIIVETGEVFFSVSAAAQAKGLHRTQVSEYLRNGKRNKRTGCSFKYYMPRQDKKNAA